MTKDTRDDNIIDSRDVIERYEELRDENEDLEGKELEAWLEENGEEFKALMDLCDDADGFSDWKDGMTLIKDSYFKTYAEGLACDVGLIKGPLHWPFNCIDWGTAADELQGDYSSVDFAGETYWGRG